MTIESMQQKPGRSNEIEWEYHGKHAKEGEPLSPPHSDHQNSVHTPSTAARPLKVRSAWQPRHTSVAMQGWSCRRESGGPGTCRFTRGGNRTCWCQTQNEKVQTPITDIRQNPPGPHGLASPQIGRGRDTHHINDQGDHLSRLPAASGRPIVCITQREAQWLSVDVCSKKRKQLNPHTEREMPAAVRAALGHFPGAQPVLQDHKVHADGAPPSGPPPVPQQTRWVASLP
jgi:hypothetical protein